jgi:transposase-like protein
MGRISIVCYHCEYEGIETKLYAGGKTDRVRYRCGSCNKTFSAGGDWRKKITYNLIIIYIQLHLQGITDEKICGVLGISRKKCAAWKKDYIPYQIKAIMDKRDKDEKLSNVINVDGNLAIVFKSKNQKRIKNDYENTVKEEMALITNTTTTNRTKSIPKKKRKSEDDNNYEFPYEDYGSQEEMEKDLGLDKLFD